MNPIEESFSAGGSTGYDSHLPLINSSRTPVKAWIRRNWCRFVDSATPIADLYNACTVVTAEKARQWFFNSGYQS